MVILQRIRNLLEVKQADASACMANVVRDDRNVQNNFSVLSSRILWTKPDGGAVSRDKGDHEGSVAVD
jgi:hypothetical protein